MGKGAGCTPSSLKKKAPTSDEQVEKSEPAPPVVPAVEPATEAPAVVDPVPDAKEVALESVSEPQEAAKPEALVKLEAKAEPELETEKVAAIEDNEDPQVKEEVKEEESVVTVKEPAPVVDISTKSEEPVELAAEPVPLKKSTAKVYVVFYSIYGHVATLAAKVKEGIDSVEGAEGFLFQVPETLSEAALAKMGAPPKPENIPVISAKDLVDADAIIFGFPTRFGMMASQMKSFFDSTGSLWQSQALAGKPAGFFFSTGTQAGGQETTALTAMSQLSHHGMLFVPIGYTAPQLFSEEVHGGSPYGAGTLAGDGTRVPTGLELSVALHQGELIGSFAAKLTRGAYL